METRQKLKLAHIDDSEIVTATVKYQLEHLGWEVVSFHTTLGTIKQMMDIQPDVILLDVNIPLIDGNTFVSVIRQAKSLEHIPIIFYSDRAEDELRRYFQTSGADGYIKKTGDGNLLDKQIRRWLNRL